MALRADDVQTTRGEDLFVSHAPVFADRLELLLGGILERVDLGLRTAAEHDIRAAARHVGRDRHRARATGFGDDVSLALVLLRVQHLVRNLRGQQQFMQPLGRLDRGRPDEHRLAPLHAILDIL